MTALSELTGLLPHGVCIQWNPVLLATHVVSDSLIALSYFSIPLSLFYLSWRRKHLANLPIAYLFSAFILSCGITHLFDILTFWHPLYIAQGFSKVITAILSVCTAIVLWPSIKWALTLPSPADLEAVNQALKLQVIRSEAVVEKLRIEVGERQIAEAALSHLNSTLEQQVEARTGELTKSEERYRSIVETAEEGIWIIDAEAKTTFVNPALTKMFGYTAEEMLGQCLVSFMDADSAALAKAKLQSPIEGREEKCEFKFIRKGGSVLWALVGCTPLSDINGDYAGALGMVTDITSRKEMEARLDLQLEKLRAEDRRKDEFLATLAHELRNPLTPVAIATSILEKEGISPDQFKWCVGSISRQTTHLKKLIDDLLDVSRINRGLITLVRKPIDLNPLLVEAIDMIAQRADGKGQRVTLYPLNETTLIEADSVRLIQVLGNLISNAIKFSPRNSVITVSATRDRSLARISIKDQGIGIKPEDQSDIFGMFSQIKEPRSPSNDGLGIGLYLVRHLIDLHGGHIEVKSDGIDKGSEFIIKLPLLNDDLTPPDAEAAKPTKVAKGLSILVVDDNLEAQATLAMYLELQDNHIHTASDGMKAIALAEAHKPQLMILDIGLPGIDGYEVCRHIRQQPWGKNMIIVALSGWGQKKDKQKAISSGFDEHFTKPLDLDALNAFLVQRESGRIWKK